MAILLFGVENMPLDSAKLNLLVSKYRLIIITKQEYSVYDPVTKVRCLHKKFGVQEGKKAFDYKSKHDVFRVLGLFLLETISRILASSFIEKPKYIEDFIVFVSSPVLPRMYQQVGLGCAYDLKIDGRPYKETDVLLPFGYEVIFDMRNVYQLASNKVRYVPINFLKKDILIPSTIKIHGGKISGRSVINNKEVEYNLNEFWLIPRAQYVRWKVIKEKLPWVLERKPVD